MLQATSSTPTPSWILTPIKPPAPSDNPSILSLEVFLDDQPTTLRGAPDSAPGTDLSGTVSIALSSDLEHADSIIVQLYGAATSKAIALQQEESEADPNDDLYPPAPSYQQSPTATIHSENSAQSLKADYLHPSIGGIKGQLPHRNSTASMALTASSSKANAGTNGADVDAEMVYCSAHEVWHYSTSAQGLQGPGAHDFRFLFKIPGTLPATDPVNGVRYVLRCIVQSKDGSILAALVEEVRIRRLLMGAEDPENSDLPAYIGGGIDDEGTLVENGDLPPPPIYTDVWKGKKRLH
ncbi:hypothetical protein HDU67_009578 [Dinochytrium kinnereticum]|nr:hypothetical protein HDU67_009578 [Dinochytrium kinnereticum]